ncbi:MAG: cyclodeaminase/cyclohydrolase family protein [Candidatus Aadella gelida]|nr:cyclodeaminase/cyclohydrolase family protein [Candidatus Aadella gelida]
MDKTEYLQNTIATYLEDLSAKRMVPGGGSVSALGASLAASLNLMVINFSINGIEDSPILLECRKEQEEGLDVLKKAIDDDCEVFLRLMKEISDKKAGPESYKNAASVPLIVCGECARSAKVSLDILPHANANLKSDIRCAVHMLKAAFYSARENVEINLTGISDTVYVESLKAVLSENEKKILEAERDILDKK